MRMGALWRVSAQLTQCVQLFGAAEPHRMPQPSVYYRSRLRHKPMHHECTVHRLVLIAIVPEFLAAAHAHGVPQPCVYDRRRFRREPVCQ